MTARENTAQRKLMWHSRCLYQQNCRVGSCDAAWTLGCENRSTGSASEETVFCHTMSCLGITPNFAFHSEHHAKELEQSGWRREAKSYKTT